MEIIHPEYDGFDWDAGNVRKAQEHGLSLGEIEDFFAQELLVSEDRKHSKLEPRLIARRALSEEASDVCRIYAPSEGRTDIDPSDFRPVYAQKGE